MLKQLILVALTLCAYLSTSAFCGFYVAKADANLFNQKSEVIIVRSGEQTVITMASDFSGEVKDFAMVVPVPVVLAEDQIRVADAKIFGTLDAYSGPRLVEYFDSDPCEELFEDDWDGDSGFEASDEDFGDYEEAEEEVFGVTIEAKYKVGEYDILILSAKESNGLKKWLIQNEYQIPKRAEAVLQPYINSGMKFFVVKVDLTAFEQTGEANLRPLQISFNSDKFMLPIRLGMANARGDQDMIVYAFSDQGRIETTNYRTVDIPTDVNVPTFVEDMFGEFYKDLFETAWKEEGKNVVFTEYGWDISGEKYTKCDPCASTPPAYADLREAGVFWVEAADHGSWGGSDYTGSLFITRLHVRYNQKTFPQDLIFQVTPNKEEVQGRYVMNIPAEGDMSCDAGQSYLKMVIERQEKELETLSSLTGWNTRAYASYIEPYREKLKSGQWIKTLPQKKEKDDNAPLPILPVWQGPFFLWILVILGSALFFSNKLRRMPKIRYFR